MRTFRIIVVTLLITIFLNLSIKYNYETFDVVNPVFDFKKPNIYRIIEEQNMDICVISYGGSATNKLVNILDKKNNYNCRTKIWKHILCHCPKYLELDIPIIFVYDDPRKSLLSIKRRNIVYTKVIPLLANNTNVEKNDEKLLQLMIQQFDRWAYQKNKNILVIKTNELFDKNIKNKLEKFLGKELTGFPIKYIEPQTKINDISEEHKQLFNKYKHDIDRINNFNPN